MDIFAPYSQNPQNFTVKNIDPQKRTLFIFQLPINFGCTRNLLAAEGISEGDIRASLLKGELAHKIKYNEIVIVSSDIDILQFNSTQLAFLQAAGITTGLQITNNQLMYVEKQDIKLVGIIDGNNTIFKIPLGFWIQSCPYKIIVYKNGVKQAMGDDYYISESGGPGTGYNTITMTLPPNAIPLPVDILTADYWVLNT